MPDTIIAERRYNVVTHIRKNRPTRVQLESYERQERKRTCGRLSGRQKVKARKALQRASKSEVAA